MTEYIGGKIADFGASRKKDVEKNAAMTTVGTPVYAAPEMMRGDPYDEKVDVYSFGMLLAQMAVTGSIVKFIKQRWNDDEALLSARAKRNPSDAFIEAVGGSDGGGKMAKRGKQEVLYKIFAALWSGDWHPVRGPATSKDNVDMEALRALPDAPASVATLAARCCALDPAERPSFADCVKELNGPCASEADAGTFVRSSLLQPGPRPQAQPPLQGNADVAGNGSPDAAATGSIKEVEMLKTEHRLRNSKIYRASSSALPPPPPPPQPQPSTSRDQHSVATNPLSGEGGVLVVHRQEC